jgi:exodeoxyribonuclease VII large subunit
VKDAVWTVAELLESVNGLFEQGFSGMRVEGEVSGMSRSARGHVYFTLKDDSAQVDAVIWAGTARRIPFDLDDGLAVVTTARLTIWAPRGRLQLVVDAIEPQGLGALQLAFEQLVGRLRAEGLFDEDRKRSLPALPRQIGIVTSSTGAALRDMVSVFRRRHDLHVTVAPTRVQGEGAGAEVAEAIRRLDEAGRFDLILVARGGGSLEDLWAFNEEVVARAIATCRTPVVSGVGHETDTTIADLVADVRAATPTRAAEMVVAQVEQQERRLDEARHTLGWFMIRHLERTRSRLDAARGSAGLARVPQRLHTARLRLAAARHLPRLLARAVDRSLHRLVRADQALTTMPMRLAAGGRIQRIENLENSLGAAMNRRVERTRHAVEGNERALGLLSPNRVLERGYSITTLLDGSTPITDASRIPRGALLCTTFVRGSVRSQVVDGPRKATRSNPTDAQPGLFEEEE